MAENPPNSENKSEASADGVIRFISMDMFIEQMSNKIAVPSLDEGSKYRLRTLWTNGEQTDNDRAVETEVRVEKVETESTGYLITITYLDYDTVNGKMPVKSVPFDMEDLMYFSYQEEGPMELRIDEVGYFYPLETTPNSKA